MSVRHGVGRAVQFGRRCGKLFRVVSLLAPSRALRRTENPRVGGSIPPLATTYNFLKRIGFSPSPADYRRPSMAHPRTIGNRVGRRRARRAMPSSAKSPPPRCAEIWQPENLENCRRRQDARLPDFQAAARRAASRRRRGRLRASSVAVRVGTGAAARGALAGRAWRPP